MSKQKWAKLYHGKEEKKPPELLIMLLQALHSKQCLTGKVQRLKKKEEKFSKRNRNDWRIGKAQSFTFRSAATSLLLKLCRDWRTENWSTWLVATQFGKSWGEKTAAAAAKE